MRATLPMTGSVLLDVCAARSCVANVDAVDSAKASASLIYERDVSWGSRRFTEYRAAGSNASAGLAPVRSTITPPNLERHQQLTHSPASRAPSDRQFVGIMIAFHSAFTGGASHGGAIRTNDPGVISAIEGPLGGADIPCQVTDRNLSVLEGSIIAIQMRILVTDDHQAEASELLVDAELGNWLRP